jgi:subtilisin-like proprotein convertase family protein
MVAPRSAAAFLVWTALVPAAAAQTFNGGGLNPGDNVPAGGTSIISVTGVPSLAGSNIQVGVTFNTAHTWVGDVILTLTGPNATAVDLIRRCGSSTAAGTGDSSNLLGTYTFTDVAANRVIDIASTGDTAFNIPVGSYRATTNSFNGNGTPTFSGETPTVLNGSFGAVGNGDWTLFYSDNVAADYAAIDAWTLQFVPVPEPASAGVVVSAAVVGLAAALRRFHRRAAGI